MQESLLFYDLETSGFNPREQRIMQFAGQRTDINLQPIGEPHNYLLKLTDDVLPDPDAILVTGITPQKTKHDGMTEAEFLKIFVEEIATPGTIFVGYNTVRFDDEFMRYLHYRNFYDPYQWHWQDGKSRWDLLDVVRMTRALRPEGIQWPFASDGKPSNKLELLASINKLDHTNAHDALSDVQATIALAKLLRAQQPRLFDYLLSMRSKNKVEELVRGGNPFVYSSGKYAGEVEKTAVVTLLADNPKSGVLVYDLRHNPTQWLDKTPEQLAEAWKWKKDITEPRLPIKTLQFNRCPAVAPLGVLDDDSKQRLKIDLSVIDDNLALLNNPEFINNVLRALAILNKQQQVSFLSDETLVDAQLYDGFFDRADKNNLLKVRSSTKESINNIDVAFKDKRLQALLPLYKARNYPKSMTDEDRQTWEDFKARKLLSGDKDSRAGKFFGRLETLASDMKLNEQQQFLLEELKLYGQSILPEIS